MGLTGFTDRIDKSTGFPINVLHTQSFGDFDYTDIQITYVTAGNGVGEIETVVYNFNGTPIRTLTLSYDSNNKLSSVVVS
jgi:hypothetical protein